MPERRVPGRRGPVPRPRPAYLSLPARRSSSAPASNASSNRSSAAARPPASPARGPGAFSPAAEPPPRGAPDSRAVADRTPRAWPAMEGAGSVGPEQGGAGQRCAAGNGAPAVTVLRDVRQEGPG